MNSGVKVLATTTAVAVAAYVVYRRATRRPKPYAEVLAALPPSFEFPAIVELLFSLPDFIIPYILPPPEQGLLDSETISGEPCHAFAKCHPDVLTVTYTYQSTLAGLKLMAAGWSTPQKRQELLDCAPDPVQMEEDLKVCEHCAGMTAEHERQGELLKHNIINIGYMAVIRATDGSLLLFNPVKITPKVQEQVEAMGGRVRWIVSGSAYHTLFMRSAVGAFPDAKVVASTGAAYKLAKVGVKVDYDYAKPAGMAALREELRASFDLLYVPDPACHMLAVIHKPSRIMFEADIAYIKDSFLNSPNSRPMGQIVWNKFVAGSPNGVFPTYRMLPYFGFFPLFPRASPNCLEEVGAALQELATTAEYDKVWSAHHGVRLMEGDGFRQWLQQAWLGWLKDPHSLIGPSAA